MIKLQNLHCSFEKRTILENISLEINNNLTILGANGSGKSTLAKAISSLISYDGDIFIEGKNSKQISLKERAKLISYIPAKLDIYDSFITVEEFVLLGRFPYKKSYLDYSFQDKELVQKQLLSLKIAHLSNNSVSSLSSGEQQLALIAQTLTQESKIIIFDEPTANLDPHNSQIMAKYIKNLQGSHQVILITHDLHLAHYVNTPVLFIKEKQADYFKNNFFNDENLEKLYGVAFRSLVVQY